MHVILSQSFSLKINVFTIEKVKSLQIYHVPKNNAVYHLLRLKVWTRGPIRPSTDWRNHQNYRTQWWWQPILHYHFQNITNGIRYLLNLQFLFLKYQAIVNFCGTAKFCGKLLIWCIKLATCWKLFEIWPHVDIYNWIESKTRVLSINKLQYDGHNLLLTKPDGLVSKCMHIPFVLKILFFIHAFQDCLRKKRLL
jgi:hypothetical protein